jgi:A/G-specific adenine glycosylase
MAAASILKPDGLNRRLLAWYDRHRRTLPWRAEPGERADPYAVWLSEIMLQQTTVATVGPYFERFLARWPDVAALAAADLDDVLHAWQGLGYYARARNLHKCARQVAGELDGRFPDDELALAKLPGIGPYTAAAVAAIAFDRPASPMDGNIERVLARLYAVETPLPGAKKELQALARQLTPQHRPGDHAQALMDLGATVCPPAAPRCGQCPWRQFCQARAQGIAGQLPRRQRKKPRPVRYGTVFWAVTPQKRVLVRRRPERGLLGGMMEFPSSDWVEGGEDNVARPFEADWRPLAGDVRHTFTHFHLVLNILQAEVADDAGRCGQWWPLDALNDLALPTVMNKVARHALTAAPGAGKPDPKMI